MKINFNKLELKDIKGGPAKPEQPIHEVIGNIIYAQAKDLNLVDIARAIYRGEEVELRDNEASEIEGLLTSENSQLLAFARKAVKDFMAEHRKDKE